MLTSGEVRDGEVTVIVQAEEAGVAGNLAAGAVLTLLSPLPGTASAGVVAEGGITGGADTESIAELLDRLLYVRRNPRWAVLCMITSSGLAKWLASAARGRGMRGTAPARSDWHGFTMTVKILYRTRKDLKTMEQYLFCHKHPATGVMVGKPGGIEVWPVQVRLKKVDLSIRLTPDGQANRNAVRANSDRITENAGPWSDAAGVLAAHGHRYDIRHYRLLLNIGEDTTSDVDELITIGEVTWSTA